MLCFISYQPITNKTFLHVRWHFRSKSIRNLNVVMQWTMQLDELKRTSSTTGT